MDWILRSLEAGVVAIIGYLVYRKDRSSSLIDDALKIKKVYQEMYTEMEAKFGKLDAELDAAIRKGEMWRGVAFDVAIEYKQVSGRIPKAWPTGEPFPEAN